VRALVTENIGKKGVRILEEEDIEVVFAEGKRIEEELPSCEAMIVRSNTKVTRALIDNGIRLKVIARAGTGVDNIDVPYATQKGIFVVNAPAGNTISVAEHTLGMMLALSRNILATSLMLRKGEWDRKTGIELYGKTVGIIGLGKIGFEVAKRCQCFGCTILAHDPFASREACERACVMPVELDELLRKSDVVTVHVPLTDSTRNLISARELSIMKPSAIVVNCARGGIINEDDLYDALKAGKIWGAAMDVFEKEPTETRLIQLDNFLGTPHIAGSTEEALERVSEITAINVAGILKERRYSGIVNLNFSLDAPPDISPFFELAEKIGLLHSNLMEGNVKKIEITLSGRLCDYRKAIESSLLCGLLAEKREEVNILNAVQVAEESGIERTEADVEPRSFREEIGVRVTSDVENEVRGTIFGNRFQRIVRINRYILDFYPEKTVLLIENNDAPGVIGRIATLLGEQGINIAEWRTGRFKDRAFAAVNLDGRLDDKILYSIRNLDDIIRAIQINFG